MNTKYFLSIILLTFAICTVSAKSINLYNKVEMHNDSGLEAVDYAVEALTKDFSRKFGSPVSMPEKDVIEMFFTIDEGMDKFDQYRIDFAQGKVTFTGSDELGLIHAIYTFSEDVLGVDPFIHFTNIMPKLESEIVINAKPIVSKLFMVKHRGFFINDEDLITGFKMEKQEYGFNLEFMQLVFETMLRAKMTCVIPSTLVLADEPHQRLASDMGLYITHHHAEPVGCVPLYWSKSEPYSWNTNKDEFIRFWRQAIERQAGRNVIWTLGFRGYLDGDFWKVDPTFNENSTDEEKAAVINAAVATQYELIKDITGDHDPLITSNMRGSVIDLFNKGLIHYPPNTMIQFTDNDGVFNSLTWESADSCKYPKGVYQHVSYHNRSGHMRVNTITPETLHHEMEMAFDHDLNNICVLNVGNIKEKIFGIQQMVNYMNDFESYKGEKDDYYYAWYVNDKYGFESDELTKVYKDLICNHAKRLNSTTIGDEYYSYAVENMLKQLCEHKVNGDKKRAAEVQKRIDAVDSFEDKFTIYLDSHIDMMAPAADRWEISMHRAYDAAALLNGNRLAFYSVDAMLPTKKMYHLSSMLNYLSKAMKAYVRRDYHTAQLNSYQALCHMDGALEVEKMIEEAHTGYFKDWYRFDQNALTAATRGYIELFHSMAINMKYLTLPYSSRNSKTPSIQYKKQPFFDSKFNRELIYMENAL